MLELFMLSLVLERRRLGESALELLMLMSPWKLYTSESSPRWLSSGGVGNHLGNGKRGIMKCLVGDWWGESLCFQVRSWRIVSLCRAFKISVPKS